MLKWIKVLNLDFKNHVVIGILDSSDVRGIWNLTPNSEEEIHSLIREGVNLDSIQCYIQGSDIIGIQAFSIKVSRK
jgi:translation initiation factor 6 (eIF-6)